MKLVKIFSDKVQIKTDSACLKNLKINDLLILADDAVSIVCIVTGLTGNDALDVYDYDHDLLGQTASNNVIDCGILGSLVNGKFTKSIDIYPTTNVEISILDNEAFIDMIRSDGDSVFRLGTYTNYNTRAGLNGNKFFQRHFAILGNTGSGKSVTVSSLLEKLSALQSSNVILFDLHGEYQGLDFVKTVKIGNGGLNFPLWFMPFRDIYSNIFRLKEESATLQLSALRKAYYSARRSKKSEDIPIPFRLNDILDALKDANEDIINTGEFYKTGDKAGQAKTVKGENNGKLTSLIAILADKMLDARYSFMCEEQPQNYLYTFINEVYGISEKNVKVVDLSDVPHDMVPVIIAIITKLIYKTQLQLKRDTMSPVDYHPLCIVCEEAHAYIPSNGFGLGASQRRLLEIFEIIAKEGRKFGTALGIVSQRPSELNKTIMAQCANFIVLKITNETDKSMVKGILPESSQSIIDTLSLFSAGDCLVIGDAADITLKIKIDLPSEMPKSGTINTWDVWRDDRWLDIDVLVDGLLVDK